MGGILVGVLAADAEAHQIQDLIIVVLPVCPVQVQSRRCFVGFASENCTIGMTGLTSCVGSPDLDPFHMKKCQSAGLTGIGCHCWTLERWFTAGGLLP